MSIGTVFLCLHCKIQDDDVESMLKGMRNSLPTPLTGKAKDFDDIEYILGGNDVDNNGYGHHVHHVYIIFIHSVLTDRREIVMIVTNTTLPQKNCWQKRQ